MDCSCRKPSQDQIDAFNIYRARGAEAGRTVNIYKASAEDLASGNQRLMMAALRRGVPPDKLAEIIRSTSPKNIMQRAEMLMAVSERGPWHRRLRDTLQTICISNILSGPPPHQRNILGNSINALLLPVGETLRDISRALPRARAGRRADRAARAKWASISSGSGTRRPTRSTKPSSVEARLHARAGGDATICPAMNSASAGIRRCGRGLTSCRARSAAWICFSG